MNKIIRIGTRGSRLALAQSYEVRERLAAAHNLSLDRFEIVIIKTSGDMITDRNLIEIGGKGLFTKEIEDQLLDGSIDLAVHSMKDMPARLPDGLFISSILPREDPRDALISSKYKSISNLPEGAVVGTSSPRRAALLLNKRPDLKIISFRGNVDTRLEKLQNNLADATLLAVAGLKRLKIDHLSYNAIEIDDMLPAVAQGAIGIESRINDRDIFELVAKINHQESAICIDAERALLEELAASCNVPVAAYANIKNDILYFRGMLASPDGRKISYLEDSGTPSDAKLIGTRLARKLSNKNSI
jgi:hydroxymethylbilane synthase